MCWVGWFRSKTCVALCPIKTAFLGFLKTVFWLFTRWRDYMDERYHRLLSMLTKILFLSNSAISLKILHSCLSWSNRCTLIWAYFVWDHNLFAVENKIIDSILQLMIMRWKPTRIPVSIESAFSFWLLVSMKNEELQLSIIVFTI